GLRARRRQSQAAPFAADSRETYLARASCADHQRSHAMLRTRVAAIALSFATLALPAAAQRTVPEAPARTEGDGPHERLIVRGVTVIDGTGAPPWGPADIVIERNRITEIRGVGAPGLPIRGDRRPQGATREIDAHGMYALPGFVDLHGHTGGAQQGTPADYVYKLWLAHGATTIRGPGSGNGVGCRLPSPERSARTELAPPRVLVYVRPGAAR